MGRAPRLVLLLLTLLVLALIGQAFGVYDVPLLRLALARMPFGMSETLIVRAPEPSQPPIVVSPKPAAASSPSPTTDPAVPSPHFDSSMVRPRLKRRSANGWAILWSASA